MSVFDDKPISYRCVVGKHETCEMRKSPHSCSYNDADDFRCECECHNDEEL